jgi:hypothetical protein
MKNYTVIRRNRILILLCLLMLVTMAAAVFAQQREQVAEPVFSEAGGFYADPFLLELTAPAGCSVYYTLDSTTPDRTSLRYTEPILIDDASKRENVYSMIEGMHVEQWTTRLPEHLIEKCTVVRAVVIPDSPLAGKPSEVVTRSFFVGFSEDYFDGLGVVSLVTDPKNLFDKKTGIYVTGEKLEEYLASTDDPEAIEWAYWPTNFSQRGEAWEREANVTIWNGSGQLLLSKDVGIRTQGGWSRAFVPRSLNLFARESYDGEGSFGYDFFGHGYELETMTLSAGGTGHVTRMNDYLMSAHVSGRAYAVMNYRPYFMFLDGEFWGFYWLADKYDQNYLQEAYGLGDSEVIIIKETLLEAGYEEDISVYRKMLRFFENTDLSVEENYAEACRLIDMESFLDYYATMIYIARMHDWPGSNEALWRTRTVEEKPYADGKWRWLLYDCNSYCMEEALIDHDTLQWAQERSIIFRSCWANPSFRDAFETRILEIADTCFPAEEVADFVEEYRVFMEGPMEKTWNRFYSLKNRRSVRFNEKLDETVRFFAGRRDVVESWFRE